jgi:hypothetical protein
VNIRKHIESLGDTIRSLERVVIDVISAMTPWLAPLVPASMVYSNMMNDLGFDRWISLIGAAAVEFLGLSAINTAVEFWRYNEDKHYRQSLRRAVSRRKSRKFNGAPFYVALFTGVFYIVVVLTVNAILDVGKEPIQNTAAKALLSLLSVDAGIIIAIRASHSRRTAHAPKNASILTHDATNATHDASIPAEAVKPKTYICSLCAEGFENGAKLAAHMRWQHANGNGHRVQEPVGETAINGG